MSPLPTRPIDDAGPLKGKTPPILISVAEIPGSSAANAGPLRNRARAATIFHLTSIASSQTCTPSRVCGFVLLRRWRLVAPFAKRHRAEQVQPQIRHVAAVAFGHLVRSLQFFF